MIMNLSHLYFLHVRFLALVLRVKWMRSFGTYYHSASKFPDWWFPRLGRGPVIRAQRQLVVQSQSSLRLRTLKSLAMGGCCCPHSIYWQLVTSHSFRYFYYTVTCWLQINCLPFNVFVVIYFYSLFLMINIFLFLKYLFEVHRNR